MFRLGIVGCGGMGNHHANVMSKLDDVKIVAACDIVKERADALAEKFGAKSYTDFRDLLDEVDVVCEAVVPRARPEVVTGCANAGKHIFSEKPLSLCLGDANRIVEAVDRNKIIFMTDYVLRFTNPYRAVHEVFASGELGRLVNVWTRRYMPVDMRGRWYGEDEQSGGVAMDFMSHDVDQLRWFGGKAKVVFGSVDRVRDGINADEHAHATVVFEQGTGTSDVSWCSPASLGTFGVVGSLGSVIVDGSGKVRKRIEGQDEVVLDVNARTETDLKGVIQKDSAASTETVQQHFFRCLREGKTPLVNVHEAYETLRVVLGAKESARTGKSVDL